MNHEPDVPLLLARAVEASVDDVVAGPDFFAAVHRRANRRGPRWLGVAAAAATVVALVGGVAWVAREDGVRHLAPAAATHPRYAPAALPDGFHPRPIAEENGYRPGDRRVWATELRYARSGPDGAADPRLGVLLVETLSGDVDPVTLEREREREPGARAVRLGGLDVIHVRNFAGKINVYAWTDEHGDVVSVTGLGAVDDAEVREFVSALRRQDVAA